MNNDGDHSLTYLFSG